MTQDRRIATGTFALTPVSIAALSAGTSAARGTFYARSHGSLIVPAGRRAPRKSGSGPLGSCQRQYLPSGTDSKAPLAIQGPGPFLQGLALRPTYFFFSAFA